MNVLRKASLQVMMALTLIAPIAAQTKHCQPATDSSAQASPLVGINKPAIDESGQASPIDDVHGKTGRPLPAHTTLHVALSEGVDSGNLKNGQTIHAKLLSSPDPRNPAKLSWKPGTPALITVVGTVPAGKLNAVGEISLELFQVGGQHVDTDILTFRGQPGHRDLPDSAPSVGTNAGLASGAPLTFHVQATASFAGPTATPGRVSPGTVHSVAVGSKPANYGQPTVPPIAGSSQSGSKQ